MQFFVYWSETALQFPRLALKFVQKDTNGVMSVQEFSKSTAMPASILGSVRLMRRLICSSHEVWGMRDKVLVNACTHVGEGELRQRIVEKVLFPEIVDIPRGRYP